MQFRLNSFKFPPRILMALVSLFFTAFAFAAPNLPDPANIPRLETQPAPPVITSPSIEKKGIEKKDSETYPNPLQTKSDILVTISQLRFSGNKNVSDAQLSALLVDFLDKPIGIKELNQMTSQVTRYYRQQGFMLAEAYLPEQDITSTLQIAVVEGYLGELKLQTKGKLDEEFLKKWPRMS